LKTSNMMSLARITPCPPTPATSTLVVPFPIDLSPLLKLHSSVVNLTILYYDLRAVIPAPYQLRGKLQRESRRRPCESRDLFCSGFPRVKHGAGSIKSGMTKYVKRFLTHST